LQAWDTVKNSDEPLIELLQLLSQQEQGPQRKRGGRAGTKIKFLHVDPALYDFILIPICIAGGKRWLLASIDVQKREMQLLDCSKNYSGRWRGQIHSILWVWFVASVRRLRARGAAIQEEPQWRIDISHVNLLDIAELPGLRSSQVRNHLVECGLKKCAPNIAKLLGGAERSCLAALNITVDEDRSNPRQWHWSSNDADALQQRRGSDCGLLTVLFAIFKARGWAMQTLGSLNPEHVRNWFLGVLNRQGQWRRAWSCTKCGAEIARRATVDDSRQCLADVTCEKAQWQTCAARRLRRSENQQPGAAETLLIGCAEGDAQGPPPGAHLPHTVLGKRGTRGQSPRRTSHTEPSAGGLHNQDTIDQCPTVKVEGELRSNGCNTGAVHAERGGVGIGGEASDIKDRRLEDAAPPVWMPPPRITAAGSERKAKVRADSPLQQMEEGQEWDKDGQHRRMQQLPLRGQAVGGAKDVAETFGAAKAPAQTTSAVRCQAVHRKEFQVGVRGQQHTQAQTKCVLCGLWGARLLADAKSSSFACNTRCLRRWQLDQLAALRSQKPAHERVCGCRDTEMMDGGDPPPNSTETQDKNGLASLSPPIKQECAGCGAEAPTCPCTRCWEVWYCTDECAQVHWQQHQTQCQKGAWCGEGGSDDQSVW
jgi:hypothetical protein